MQGVIFPFMRKQLSQNFCNQLTAKVNIWHLQTERLTKFAVQTSCGFGLLSLKGEKMQSKPMSVPDFYWGGPPNAPLQPSVERAMEGVRFIADHLKEEDKEQQVYVNCKNATYFMCYGN